MNSSEESVSAQWDFLEKKKKHLTPMVKQLVHAAALRPELRKLFPVLSLDRWLHFSRFTEYPYAFDCPHVGPSEQEQGILEAHDVEGHLIARGDISGVLDAVVAHLPPEYGAARGGSGPF